MSRDWEAVNNKLGRSKEKYEFYFGNYTYEDFSNGTIASRLPIQHIGWGKRAVEMRANKTHFDKFENDTLGLNEIFEKYRVLEAFDKLKEDILVCGCGFLAVTDDRVFPFTAEEATGTYNWEEQNLKEGLAVFREDTKKGLSLVEERIPTGYIEYFPEITVRHDGNDESYEPNVTGRPLMAMLTHKSTTKRPFGRSVISGPARSAIIDASRTVRQAMIAAYHYNTKVDVLLGVDNDTAVDKIKTSTGDILKVGPNENGQIPSIGEFAQHALAPFNDTILVAARNFCSDTKLSLANLGISTAAPQSTEALEILNDDLKDDIKEWQLELGEQLKYFAVTLFMKEQGLRTLNDNMLEKIRAIKPVFKSVYNADLSKFGDGLLKIASQTPDIIKARSIWREIGLTSDEIDKVIDSQVITG